MSLFPSLASEGNSSGVDYLDTIHQGSLFQSIEYELSGILKKIINIDSLDEKEMNDIIIRQHSMILDYDLFLVNENRRNALILFTNKRFLQCFLNVIRLIELSRHEKICLNKIAYDYYILPKHDKEVADLLYRLTTEVNGKEVVVLSGILGIQSARILSMIRNSTFKEEKAVHRVNTFLIKCNQDLTAQQIISIYCYLFERFTYPFIYTMLETKPAGLTGDQNRKFDNISIALLAILDSLSSSDMKKVLSDYAITLSMVKVDSVVRFSIKTAISYPRILKVIKEIEISSDLRIP